MLRCANLRSALNKRFTLSSGHGYDVSGWVVMISLPRTTSLIHKLRINRSTAALQCMFTCTRGGAAGDIFPFPPQNMPNLPRAIELAVGIPSRVDLDAQGGI